MWSRVPRESDPRKTALAKLYCDLLCTMALSHNASLFICKKRMESVSKGKFLFHFFVMKFTTIYNAITSCSSWSVCFQSLCANRSIRLNINF
jgi:hypothetical protein